MKKKLKKTTVLYNFPDAEEAADLDTQKSAFGVADGLREAGYKTDVMGISESEIKNLRFKITNLGSDLVFNLVEWSGLKSNLGARVIDALEKTGIPYTGSNSRGYLLSCDKRLMKQAMAKYQIPTPNWQIVDDEKFKILNLKFPLIVKPTLEHCAIGVNQKSVVTNEDDLRFRVKDLMSEFKQPVLVEEFIDGDEAQVTVLEKSGRPWVLPPAVFRYRRKDNYWPINTYDAKWGSGWESAMSEWIDDVDLKIESEMIKIARLCYLKLGGRSYPRMDMRLDKGGRVYVLEVNNNPGIDFDPESGITHSAVKAGLNWQGLLANIVEEAYRQYRHDAVSI